jgi:hypothetical protein
MKGSKALAALQARRSEWDKLNVSQRDALRREGMMAHRPGSQNPKKGYGGKRSRR